jgi:hypothetical protein
MTNVTFVLGSLISDDDTHPSPCPIRSTEIVRTPFVRIGFDAVKVKSLSVSLYKNVAVLNNVIFRLNVGLLHENAVD